MEGKKKQSNADVEDPDRGTGTEGRTWCSGNVKAVRGAG